MRTVRTAIINDQRLSMIDNLDNKYASKDIFEEKLNDQKDINIQILESVQLINKDLELAESNIEVEIKDRQVADKILKDDADFSINLINNDIKCINEELFNLRNIIKYLKYAILGLFILIILENIGLVCLYSNLNNKINNISNQYNIEDSIKEQDK